MNDGQNRVGLIVDPERDELPFSFTVEVFEAGTVTEMAVNPGFELFYVLQGKGTAFCEGEKVRSLTYINSSSQNASVVARLPAGLLRNAEG